MAGGDLPVVTAPRGINLRQAITQHLSQQQQLEGSASAPRGGVLPALASVPGTPATLPCGLGSAVGTPLAAATPSAPPGPDGQQQKVAATAVTAKPSRDDQQAAACLPGGTAGGAVAEPQPEKAADSATWQWLMQSRFTSREADSSRAGQPPPEVQHPGALPPQVAQPAHAGSQRGAATSRQGSAAGSAAEELTAAGEQERQPVAQQAPAPRQGQPSGLHRPRATTLDQLEVLQSAAPAVRLDGTRPWTYDDAGGPAANAAVGRQHARELEVEYRWRAAARMWPMLAPFVPRLLRQYLAQTQPVARGDRCASAGSAHRGC